jgi:hypothetical protein
MIFFKKKYAKGGLLRKKSYFCSLKTKINKNK